MAGTAPERSESAEAFWAAAASPSALFSPLHAHSEEPPATAWCEGQGQPSCAPAAPNAPHNTVSFAHAPVAVLPKLNLRHFASSQTPRYFERAEDGRDGVRMRIERPPIA